MSENYTVGDKKAQVDAASLEANDTILKCYSVGDKNKNQVLQWS